MGKRAIAEASDAWGSMQKGVRGTREGKLQDGVGRRDPSVCELPTQSALDAASQETGQAVRTCRYRGSSRGVRT